MLNWVWFGLLAAGIVYAAINGNIEMVTAAAFEAANDTIVIIIEICGMICLWLGMLKIAEASGMVRRLGRMIAPVVRLLFPEVPEQHPAFSSIVMNISANLLGLGNAATPFGLKAMEHLQSLNSDKLVATPSMITLLVMNTSCITIIPTLVISLRVAAGSAAPTAIIGATVISSCIGLSFALIVDRILRRRYYRR